MIQENHQWLKQGLFVDAKDKSSEWQIGYVINITKNQVKIRFDGWQSKYDDIFFINSQKLKPLRTFIRGYTGPKKNPAIREHWKFNYQKHKNYLADFNKFVHQINNKTEYEVTQFLRGFHYFYIDFLMTNTYANKEEMQSVFQYFYKHIDFTLNYLKQFNINFPSKWFNKQQVNNSSFSAYIQGYYEYFDSLYTILGAYTRLASFQKNNDKLIKQIRGQQLTYESYMNRLLTQRSFLQNFQLMLNKIIKYSNYIPLSFMRSVFHGYSALEKVMQDKQLKKKLAMILWEIMKKQIDLITPGIVKNQQKQAEQIFSIMKMIYFKYTEKNDVYLWIDYSKLHIWSTMILTDSLQKRIKGLTKIKQYCQFIIKNNIYEFAKISKGEFIKWIKERQLLTIMFEHNQHVQAIKKGCQLIKLFYIEEVINIEQLVWIWNTCKNKHQAVHKSIMQFWLQIFLSIKPEERKLFTDVVTEHPRLTDESKIFLFDFTQKTVKKYANLDNSYALINICYEEVLKDERFLMRYAQIIGFTQSKKSPISQIIIQNCFAKIKIRSQCSLHIQLVALILAEFYGKQVLIPQNAIKILITQLKIAIKEQNAQNNLILIFKLINEVLMCNDNDYQFLDSEFQELWNIFYGFQQYQLKLIFYHWICQPCQEGMLKIKGYMINSNFQAELRYYIFRQILCDNRKFDMINMTIQQFQMFKEFMLYINSNNEVIERKTLLSGYKKFKINQMDIEGTKQLWDMFFNCKNQKVIEQLTIFIKNLHFHFSSKMLVNLQQSKLDTLLEKLAKHIKQGMKKSNIKLVRHSLLLLNRIMLDISQKYQIPKQYNYTQCYSNKTIISVAYGQKQTKLQIPIGDPFFLVKNRIAKLFGLKTEQFSISTQTHQVQQQSYIFPYFSLGLDNHLKIIKKQNLFKNLILQFINEKLYASLIELLATQYANKQSFMILEKLNYSFKDASFIENAMNKNINLAEKNLFFNYHFLKVFCEVQMPAKDQLTIFRKMLNQIKFQINSQLTIGFILSFLEAFAKLFKLEHLQQNQNDHYADMIMQMILSLVNYTNSKKFANTKKQSRLFNQCFVCLQILKHQKILDYFLNHVSFKQLLKTIYIEHKFDIMKIDACRKFEQYFQKFGLRNEKAQKVILFLINSLYMQIKDDRGNMARYTMFFRLLSSSLMNSSQQFVKTLQCGENDFYQIVVSAIYNQQAQQNLRSNPFLYGHIQLLQAFHTKLPILITSQIVDYILFNCLFFDKKKTATCPKVKTKQTLQVTLRLLLSICKHASQQLSQYIMSILIKVQTLSYWRTCDNFNVNIQQQNKSITGYVGLDNPGCICYLNSFMQQLFMIKQFRNAVLNEDIERKEDINYQLLDGLKILFLKLKYSEEQYINPLFFTRTMKNANNKSMIKIYQQMDIDEYCSILFDKLQHYCHEDKNFIRNLFGGIYSNQIISLQCKHTSQRQQTFLSISLDVKKSIIESFQALVKGQMLQGENAYYCERCDKKVRAEKRLSLKKLPEYLMITLKRFQFNYQIDQKIKINDYCQFPTQLDLTEYSLQKRHVNDEQIQTNPLDELPKNYFKYKLKGIVVHTGYADSGHYYSYIEDDNGKWFQFNDNKVSEFDPKNIAQEAFGGKQNLETKIKNAYVLIYERQKLQNTQINTMQQQQPYFTKNKTKIQQIKQINHTIQKFHLIFSNYYSNFILSLIQNINHKLKTQNKVFLTYYMCVKLRQRDLLQILQFTSIMQKILKNDEQLLQEFIRMFNNQNVLDEFFTYLPIIEKSKILSHLLVNIITSVEIIKKQQTINLIRAMISILVKHQLNISEIIWILRQLSVFDNITENIYKSSMITIIMKNFTGFKQSLENYPQLKYDSETNVIIQFACDQQQKTIVKTIEKEAWHMLYNLSAKYKDQIRNKFLQLEKPQNNKHIINLIQQSTHNKTIIGMTYVFSLLSTQYLDFISKLFSAIQAGLRDYESVRYRQFMLLLHRILQINDSFANFRVGKILKIIQQSLIVNEKYFMECDFIIQWLLKFANDFPAFYTRLKLNHKLIDFALKIVNAIKFPSLQTLKKHKNPNCQKLLQKLHGIVVSSDSSDYASLYQNKILILQKIKNDKFVPVKMVPEGIINENCKVGCIVHYWCQQWVPMVITENKYGFLKLQTLGKQKYETTCFQDSQKFKITSEMQIEH